MPASKAPPRAGKWTFRYRPDRSWRLPQETADAIAELLGLDGRRRVILRRVEAAARDYFAEIENEERRPRPGAARPAFRYIARQIRKLQTEVDRLRPASFRDIRRGLGDDTPFLELVPERLQSLEEAAETTGERRVADLAAGVRSAIDELDGNAALNLDRAFAEQGWSATLAASLRQFPTAHQERRKAFFFLDRVRVAAESFDARGRPQEIAAEVLVWELLSIWKRARETHPRRNFDSFRNEDIGPFYDFFAQVVRAGRPHQPIPRRRIRTVLDSVSEPRRKSPRKRKR